VLAMCAGLYHVLSHAAFKGLLFLSAGSVYKTTGLREMEKMGGLIKIMPATGLFFLVGAMGASALPPFGGFVSELLTFHALFLGVGALQGWAKIIMVFSAAALALASGLAAACFVKAFGITFLAAARSTHILRARESCFMMKSGMALLAVSVLLCGVGAGFFVPLVSGVAQAVLGVAKADVSFRVVTVLPPIVALIVIVVAVTVFICFKFVVPNRRIRYTSWDCGYYSLESRTEYTATAFSKPFRIAFSFFLLPYRKSEKIRDSFYHVRTFRYETHTTSIFKRYFYEPLLRVVYAVALTMQKIQPGSIHLYLLYIFVVLIGLIAASALF
jgi:hydrogenase-4 component B